MATSHGIQGFYKLLLALDDLPQHERTQFLKQVGVDHAADLLIEDNPDHLTLLKRGIALLTLIPMEERQVVEDITAMANQKHIERIYNQSSLFSNSSDSTQESGDNESEYPSPA